MKGQTNRDHPSKQGDFEGKDKADFELDRDRAVMIDGFLKKPVSLHLDPDVITFFKAAGSGYQTRINAVLRPYMDAQKKLTPR